MPRGHAWGGSLMVQWNLNPLLKPTFSNIVRGDERLDAQVEQFWKLETSEALANSLPQFSVEDKKAVDIWERSVRIVDGRHYYLDIPFKSEDFSLRDNRNFAEKRL